MNEGAEHDEIIQSSILTFHHACALSCSAMAYYFSNAFESLGASPTLDSFMAGVRKQAYAFMALGGIIFVTITVQGLLIESAAEEMTRELKNSWLRALLRQDLAFYDIRDVPGQASLITANGARFRKGVGRKLADAVQFSVAFVGSVAYGLWASW
jgi:ATP-binding cassette subfamily B (MDR/TAP) protein 1